MKDVNIRKDVDCDYVLLIKLNKDSTFDSHMEIDPNLTPIQLLDLVCAIDVHKNNIYKKLGSSIKNK